MKIVVLGASGGTGRQVVTQAVAAGIDVTAVVREGSRAPDDATVVRADLTDRTRLADAMRGADAVVSALGGRGRGPTTVCTDGVRAAIEAMREAGVTRLIVVSAAGLPGEGEDLLTRRLVKPIVSRVFRHPYADMAAMEQLVRASGLEWTIVRPARLVDRAERGDRAQRGRAMSTDRAGGGRYRREVDRHVRGGHTTARADVATELLRALDDRSSVDHMVAIAD